MDDRVGSSKKAILKFDQLLRLMGHIFYKKIEDVKEEESCCKYVQMWFPDKSYQDWTGCSGHWDYEDGHWK